MNRKTFILTMVVLCALLMLVIPAQEVLAAGCAEAAGKAAITTGLVFFGLSILDCLFTGCTFTITTLTAAKAALAAGAYGCAEAWLWTSPASKTPR